MWQGHKGWCFARSPRLVFHWRLEGVKATAVPRIVLTRMKVLDCSLGTEDRYLSRIRHYPRRFTLLRTHLVVILSYGDVESSTYSMRLYGGGSNVQT